MKKLAVLLVFIACSPGTPTAPVVAPPAEPGLKFTYPVPKYDSLWKEGPIGMRFHPIADSLPWTKTTVRDVFRAGYSSERFEIRPGYCKPSDCLIGNERSQRTEAVDNFVDGEEWWYGWSHYVPEPLFDPYTWFGEFMESPVPGVNNWNPFWMFMKRPTEEFCLVYLAFLKGGWSCDNRNSKNYRLISDQEFVGHWTDIVVHAKWTLNNNGFTHVWINGVLMVEYAGATRTPNTANVYFSYGAYRKATSMSVPLVIFYDEIRKGKTREEVDIRILEKR